MRTCSFLLLPMTLGLTALAVSAQAQPVTPPVTPPDAGRTLQELRRAPVLPSATTPLDVSRQVSGPTTPGGMQVMIRRVDFTGNTVFSEKTLRGVVGDVAGQRYDLAGLKNLADRVSAYYHAENYPFAKAVIGPQTMADGRLVMTVVEGRYGTVAVTGDNRHLAAAQRFLHDLEPGALIAGDQLERTTLILDDQPGYRFTPVVRPGATVGLGDLEVRMQPEKAYGGNVGMDTHGNRYTGQVRGLANVYADSTLAFGDRVTLASIYTEENMWYGAAGYSRPLGYSGLRGNVGYTQTYYQLGKEFKALDAQGRAKIASTGLSYPLLRAQAANVALTGSYQHKWLTDAQGALGNTDRKSSDVVPVGLTFDARDRFGGGGVTFGGLTYTYGLLDLDSDLRTADMTTAQSDGGFSKVNLDVARVQATLWPQLTLFGRVSGQKAGHNLDSSEDFGLGGPGGVRAYPSGEGFGDEGWLAQLEARYAFGDVVPYAFYDHGFVRTNRDNWTSGDNTRAIAGAGVGMRASYQGWSADASAAWRTLGGVPESDTRDAMPQLWLTLGYAF